MFYNEPINLCPSSEQHFSWSSLYVVMFYSSFSHIVSICIKSINLEDLLEMEKRSMATLGTLQLINA